MNAFRLETCGVPVYRLSILLVGLLGLPIPWAASGELLPNVGTFEWSISVSVDGGTDSALGVCIDSAGNVISSGYLAGGLNESRSAYAAKYSRAGSIDWEVTREEGPYDPAVVGTQNAGKQSSDDIFYDVAVDAEDNFFLGGALSGTWSGYVEGSYHTAMLLQKHGMDNGLLWERTYHDTVNSAWQYFSRLLTDAGGAVYGAGTAMGSWGGVEYRWIALKYDDAGTIALGPIHHNHSPSFHLPDNAADIALDAAGNIIVVGRIGVTGTEGSPTLDFDWHVRKYAPDGTLIWADTRDGNRLSDQATAVAVLPGSNDLLVGGYVNHGTDNADNADYDWRIMRYDALGAVLGEWTFGTTGTARNDICRDVQVAADGSVYAAGDRTDDSNNRLAWVVALDPTSGATRAETLIPGVFYVNAIDVRDGYLAMAGQSGTDTETAFWTSLLRLAAQNHEAAAPYHGGSGRTMFDAWTDAADGTVIDFESLAAPSALSTELASQGVTFRSTYDPPATNDPIDRHVVVHYRNATYGNVIMGSPSWGGAMGIDGRVIYQVDFATPQRWAGIDRVWYSIDAITRFYNPAGDLLYTIEGTGNTTYEAYFHGLWMKTEDTADWIARIELDGVAAGVERNVGDADNLVFGTADPTGIDPCATACLDYTTDTDGDGLDDCFECQSGFDGHNPDTDGDGMDDHFEFRYGLDPLVGDGGGDLDNDGYTNLEEYLRGADPSDADSPEPAVFVSTSGNDTSGDGSYAKPWRTIRRALQNVSPTEAVPVKVYVRTGTYDENITLKPWVVLSGDLDGSPVLSGTVVGAADARIENFEIVAPDHTAHTLLTLNNVAMEVVGVAFRGTITRTSTGILTLGAAGADTLVANCSFNSLLIGIHMQNGIPVVRRCSFNQPARAGILVEGTTGKAVVKSIGDATDPRTGWNTFRIADGGALAVENNTGTTLVMQNNDWGVSTVAEADALISGGAEIEPILAVGDAILAGAVYCKVQDWATQDPVLNASVSLTPSGYTPVTENENGVYGFPVVAPATYTLVVTAPGYAVENRALTAPAGDLTTVIVTLRAGTAEGEGEGEKTGPGCGVGSVPVGGAGDVVPLLLAMALCCWHRRKGEVR